MPFNHGLHGYPKSRPVLEDAGKVFPRLDGPYGRSLRGSI